MKTAFRSQTASPSACLTAFLIVILASLLGVGQPVAADDAKAQSPENVEFLTLPQAAIEFQYLRSINGHFSGGHWTPSVDRWMDRKHRLMRHIERLVLQTSTKTPYLVQVMGKPDIIITGKEAGNSGILTPESADLLKTNDAMALVYYWRGSHDGLIFFSSDNTVISSQWWFAGE